MRSAFRRSAATGLPFVVVMVPFGALFGVIGTEAGLPLAQVMGVSIAVIAGAAQFTAVQVMGDGVPVAVVILSALAVNLRIAMYSASIAPWLGAAPLWQRAAIVCLLAALTFAWVPWNLGLMFAAGLAMVPGAEAERRGWGRA